MRKYLNFRLNISDEEAFISSGISFHTCTSCTFVLHFRISVLWLGTQRSFGCIVSWLFIILLANRECLHTCSSMNVCTHSHRRARSRTLTTTHARTHTHTYEVGRTLSESSLYNIIKALSLCDHWCHSNAWWSSPGNVMLGHNGFYVFCDSWNRGSSYVKREFDRPCVCVWKKNT